MEARAAHRPSAQTCRSPAAGRQPIELSPRDLLQRFWATLAVLGQSWSFWWSWAGRGPLAVPCQVVVPLAIPGQVVVPLAIPG